MVQKNNFMEEPEKNTVQDTTKKKVFSDRHIQLLGCFLLTIFIFLSFFSVPHFDFVHYDDHVYVTDNPAVKTGLAAESISWALTSLDAGFWHPLTWLSLMLDYELYGLNAGGYHVTNILLHIINTLLLFIILGRMTGTLGRSFFVAALFALHPLHVESVAWIAARKDVLSTFFMMLTLWGYVHYVKNPGVGRYLLMVIAFVLGLTAKPMLVTLPFILLLLDLWPLGRFAEKQSIADSKQLLHTGIVVRLLLEKVPLLILAAGVSVVTVIAEGQAGALAPMISYSLDVRMSNALVSYVLYIGKMFCPVNLTVFYPHPGSWPVWTVILSALFLGAISYCSIRCLRKYPYFATGWFWYLGTLIPVIGLVQVGTHGMADRYTYIPLIGLFIAIAWGSVDILKRLSHYKAVLGVFATVILAACGIQSYLQAQYWENAIRLFRHAVDVTDKNYIAYNNLGAALARRGNPAEAVTQYRKAIKIIPQYLEAHFNMGAAFADQGEFSRAVDCYQRALNIRPDFAEAHNNLAIVLARQGQLEEAIQHFQMALIIRNNYRDARNNLSIAEQELKKQIKEK